MQTSSIGVQIQGVNNNLVEENNNFNSKYQPYFGIVAEWRWRSSQNAPSGDLFERTIEVFRHFKNPSRKFCVEFLEQLSNEQELTMIGNWMISQSESTALKSYEAMVQYFYCGAVTDDEDEGKSYYNCTYLKPIDICKAHQENRINALRLPLVHKSYADGKIFSGIDCGDYLQGCCFQQFGDGYSYQVNTLKEGKFFNVTKDGVNTLVISGEGFIRHSDGVDFRGIFELGSYMLGRMRTNNFTYSGSFKDDNPSGKGVLRSCHGYSAHGEFVYFGNGKVAFEGALVLSNGASYQGNYFIHLPTGQLMLASSR